MADILLPTILKLQKCAHAKRVVAIMAYGGRGDGQRMFDNFLVVRAKQIQTITCYYQIKHSQLKYSKNLKLQKCAQTKRVVALCCSNNG